MAGGLLHSNDEQVRDEIATELASDEPVEQEDDQNDGSGRRRLRPDLIGFVLVAVATLVAVVFSARSALAAGWSSVSDIALIELRVRDVPGEFPLLGVYSRFGWNHPGPGHFLVLSPVYRLAGSSSAALLVSALAVQFGAVIAAVAAIRRFSTVGAWACVGASAALFCGLPSETLRSPWNPYVALGGVVALVALGWALAQRRRSGALALVPLGSLIVQAHVVTVPIVVAVVAGAVVLMVIPRRGASKTPVPWWALGAGVALTALVWTPPLIEQATNDPGNLERIVNESTGSGGRVGLSTALNELSGALGPVPSSLERTNISGFGDPMVWTSPVWSLALVAGLAAAIATRNVTFVRGWIVAGCAVLGSVVSIAMLSGVAFGYLRLGLRSAMLMWIAISVGALVAAVGHRFSHRALRHGASATATIAALVVISVLGVQGAHSSNPEAGPSDGVPVLADAFERFARGQELDSADALDVTASFDLAAALYAPGLMVELERRGWAMRSNYLGASLVGEHRVGDAPGGELLLVGDSEAEAHEKLGWELVVAYEPLSATERRELRAVEERFGFDGSLSLDLDESEFEQQKALADAVYDVTQGRVAVALLWRPTPSS